MIFIPKKQKKMRSPSDSGGEADEFWEGVGLKGTSYHQDIVCILWEHCLWRRQLISGEVDADLLVGVGDVLGDGVKGEGLVGDDI